MFTCQASTCFDRWCSILVITADLKAGLKIRQGHTDEVPGAGCRRPVGGWYWELRGWGDLQWHVGVDPAPVETQVCGSFVDQELWLGV